MSIWQWLKTAAGNATADPSINWAEGQAPSSVNDSSRAEMAVIKKWVDDISGGIATAGTSTAYTLTTNSVFDTAAHADGQMVAFVPHTTNGATVTINVDSVGVKPLRSSPGVELGAGTLLQGTPYVATFNNSDGAWYLQGFVGNPFNVPLGGLMPYVGATAPNSNFAIPIGQAISRTTFATLFALTGTTFGVGDGTTTFNLPDLRGRTVFGPDSGGSARITVAGQNFDGTVRGGTGGSQNRTIANGNLPASIPYTDPGHVHGFGGTASGPDNSSFLAAVQNGGTPGVNAITSATTGIIINQGGANTALSTLPPAIILPFILRII